jgi:hypothetical protein
MHKATVFKKKQVRATANMVDSEEEELIEGLFSPQDTMEDVVNQPTEDDGDQLSITNTKDFINMGDDDDDDEEEGSPNVLNNEEDNNTMKDDKTQTFGAGGGGSSLPPLSMQVPSLLNTNFNFYPPQAPPPPPFPRFVSTTANHDDNNHGAAAEPDDADWGLVFDALNYDFVPSHLSQRNRIIFEQLSMFRGFGDLKQSRQIDLLCSELLINSTVEDFPRASNFSGE